MRYHNNLPPSAIDWFRVHYQPSNFDGRFRIGYRSNDTKEIYRLAMFPLSKLTEFLEEMHVSSKLDYYITPNSFSGVQRTSEGLFSLHNIVIDIDAHGADPDGPSYSSSMDLKEAFLRSFKRDVMAEGSFPSPNSVVMTGRGFQFWWAIVPMSCKCLSWYKEIRSALISRIRVFLDEYREFKCFKVDGSASSNTVGYFRLPGTVNTKTLTTVTAEIWRREQHSTHDMIDWAKNWEAYMVAEASYEWPETDNFVSKYGSTDVYFLKDIHTNAFFRLRQLTQLRLLRDNDVGEETRNNMCFIAYNAMLPSIGPEKAWEKLCLFNSGFKDPMTEKELHQTIDTSLKKGGYKYSNEAMIEFLGITPGEQEAIGLYAPTQPYTPMTRLSNHPSRQASRRLAKAVRDDNIKELYSQGMSCVEIGERLGVTAKTAHKISGIAEAKLKKELEMTKMIEAHKKREEIAQMFGVSMSTVTRLTKKIKKVSKT